MNTFYRCFTFFSDGDNLGNKKGFLTVMCQTAIWMYC